MNHQIEHLPVEERERQIIWTVMKVIHDLRLNEPRKRWEMLFPLQPPFFCFRESWRWTLDPSNPKNDNPSWRVGPVLDKHYDVLWSEELISRSLREGDDENQNTRGYNYPHKTFTLFQPLQSEHSGDTFEKSRPYLKPKQTGKTKRLTTYVYCILRGFTY